MTPTPHIGPTDIVAVLVPALLALGPNELEIDEDAFCTVVQDAVD